jgi:hypothetical protein
MAIKTRNHRRLCDSDSGQVLEAYLKDICKSLSIDSPTMDCRKLANLLYKEGYIKDIELASMLKALYFHSVFFLLF